MSLYFLILILLAAGTLLAWCRSEYEKKIYWGCWGIMTVCLCLRFGQGTDYITMHGIYNTIPVAIDLSKGYICGFLPEIGWRLISAFFKMFHAPFWAFTMVLGFLEMLLVHRFLSRYVEHRTAGLFLLYPVLFITYMVSGLRQGLAICVFLGILMPFYLEKKWVQYILGVLVASSFHRVGYAWLILPVVAYLSLKIMAILAGLSVMGGLVLQIGSVEQFFTRMIPFYHLEQFLLNGTVSKFAVAERLLSFLVIFLLYIAWKRGKGSVDEQTELFLKAYICGVCFYMLLSGSSYYASRYCIIFKVLEGAVLLLLVQNRELISKLALGFFFCLTLLMGYKNLNAMIQESYWYDDSVIKVWNFPYISVFNQEKILEYLPYDERLAEIYRDNVADQKLWMIEE